MTSWPEVASAGEATAHPAAADWDRDGLSADGAWLELSVASDIEAVEAVSEILSRHAGGGTSVEPAFRLLDEGLAAAVDPTRPAIVRAYVPALDRAAARAAVEGARRDLAHLQAFGLRPIGELEVVVVHESDWAEAWKSHFPVLRVGRHVVIRPTWRRARRRPGDVVLSLDPGMAFGTGLHPTTRLCLEGIERWAGEGIVAGSRVLDVGCGSGILAVGAARFGAADVLGIDTDPIAVEATRANARRNRVARLVHAQRGTLPTGGVERRGADMRGGADVPRLGRDLVLANLIASLLVDLAAQLRAELRPGGRLLASGIFIDRENDVARAFDAAGLAVTGRWAEGDWVALEARRPGGSRPDRSSDGSAS
ncbi:MAG TPA: 50S ribosomal protein L11 methyltransferase [Candidatus Limnocylindrales bacterium]